MSIENYLRYKVEEQWTPEEIKNYNSHVPNILEDFYFKARRGLEQGVPVFETRFPEGRMRALVEGIGVRDITIGVSYDYLIKISDKGKLLEFLEKLAISAHGRRLINLTGYGRNRGEQDNISKEFRKTQERNVKQFWKK